MENSGTIDILKITAAFKQAVRNNSTGLAFPEQRFEELMNLPELQDALGKQILQYSKIPDFKKVFEASDEKALLETLIAQDITLPFAVAGRLGEYNGLLDLFLQMLLLHYGLKAKAKLKYNIFVNALFQSQESLGEFQQKINRIVDVSSEAVQSISFPAAMMQNIRQLQEGLLFPENISPNDEQCLTHMRCLLAVRKIFSSYFLIILWVLQGIDDRSKNERVGTHCSIRMPMLFAGFLETLHKQMEKSRSTHYKSLENRYNPENAQGDAALKVWFDILDICFEHDQELRKLKLYISSLGAADLNKWHALMSQRFQNSPGTLEQVNQVKQMPLNYQDLHTFAIDAYRKHPKIQQQIMKGMKIVESMQGRFATYIKSMKTKHGAAYSPNRAEIYEFFQTVQESREGSSFFRNDEKTLLPRNNNQTPEMQLFIKLSNYKRRKLLEMVFAGTQNKFYVQSIAWQLYHWKDPKVFPALVDFLSADAANTDAAQAISAAFAAPQQMQAQKNMQTQQQLLKKQKQDRFKKSLSQLRSAKGSFEEGETIMSENYIKDRELKKKLAEQKEQAEATGKKALTSNDIEDYIQKRRAMFVEHLVDLREQRAQMTEKQKEVSESTEMFMEAEINMNDALATADITAVPDIASVDQFELDTLSALSGYDKTCSAQGHFKKEYFENQKNTVQGMLKNLKEQIEDESADAAAASKIMENVHDVMKGVQSTMHDLSEEIPTNAEEKLKVLLKEEEDGFNAMMEKEFEIEVRDSKVAYKLKSFIILPIPAKQKIQAVKSFSFTGESALSDEEMKSLDNFLFCRSSFATQNPIEITGKDGSVQMNKLGDCLWYETLLYHKVPFGFEKDAGSIILLDFFALPLKTDGTDLFGQHIELLEKLLMESKSEMLDTEFKERVIRDVKNKRFQNNIANQSKHKQHIESYDVFPESGFDHDVFKKVQEWYQLRKEDQKLNYYKLKEDGKEEQK
ncbi:MAG: hypothetical protein HQM14_13190 [SAR324 cluster bacterium]|nr:hypothetical protein [SAR324 cluster bacterium]